MKIRLTRPLPQISLGKVIPAGVIIEAPPGLCARLLREGKAEPTEPEKTQSEPVTTAKKRPQRKVKQNGKA